MKSFLYLVTFLAVFPGIAESRTALSAPEVMACGRYRIIGQLDCPSEQRCVLRVESSTRRERGIRIQSPTSYWLQRDGGLVRAEVLIRESSEDGTFGIALPAKPERVLPAWNGNGSRTESMQLLSAEKCRS